ncbi:hypothetical protein SAMN06265222_109130 [Neorhodopirellula lusitana]|uniref:Uncharacterized protein n=1 Tax=Neorhodopirellula lusitana TaxID=445327 RepID=A0ABY1QAL4_9BACT|nr:hypothetical protein [Neorhodopirellula lusitana]SMP65723.1 hypothetical protein SAMN06265222_109130 [Neorhodopirellula lusitana]
MTASSTTNEPAVLTSSARPDPGYRAFRARKEDRTALIDPVIGDSELLLKQNLADDLGLSGSSESVFWHGLGQQARQQLTQDARRYTSAYRTVSDAGNKLRQDNAGGPVLNDLSARPETPPIVMAGHQPTLFHPGVWFKNFALQHIGQETGALPINLVIDNDVAAGRSIRVPVRDSLGRARVSSVSYDSGGAGIPFEQAKIRDLRQFDAFEKAVRTSISPLVKNPLILSLWPHARDAIRRCEIAGCALAQARHSLEETLGWNTLEIPLGVAVRGLPFARFVLEWIDDFERFHQVYNDSADHYRAWHGIRSNAHPVPNLTVDGEYWELPLWVYGNDSPTRRAVWVRRTGGQLEISDRSNERPRILLPAGNRDRAATILAESTSSEFKLRPRALITTMFARLLLSDLFLHGIGGGKYDQLADRIMSQFYGIQPPAFQVVSATLRLPGQSIDHGRPDQIQALQRQIRDTQYQGEHWASGDTNASGNSHNAHEIADSPAIQALANQKRDLLAQMPTSGPKQDWHRKITAVNTELSALLEPRRATLRAELAQLRQASAEEQILASREWSFCLFPLEYLVPAFEEMLVTAS